MLIRPAVARQSNAPAPALESVPPTNAPVIQPDALKAIAEDKEAANAAWHAFADTNSVKVGAVAPKPGEDFQLRLEIARHHRLARLYPEAEAGYTAILEGGAPQAIQRPALLELARTVREENDLARAQQIYAQFVNRWPKDEAVPEVLLDEGLIFRELGLNSLAISKFYSVMTSALAVRSDRFDFYQQLVLRAQNEIAETEYRLGLYADAVDAFARLLKLESPPTNRPTLEHRYIQCLVALGRREEAIAEAQDFLTRWPAAPERPEVRFLSATALKESHRDTEALQQVLGLLQEQQATNGCDAQSLAFWKRRAGNELANQFYRDGDHLKALDLYTALAALDSSAEWQLPVWYQIGLVCERLNQPARASSYYDNISRREPELGTNAAPSLKAVVEMARWRKDFLGWQLRTEAADVEFRATANGTSAPVALPPRAQAN